MIESKIKVDTFNIIKCKRGFPVKRNHYFTLVYTHVHTSFDVLLTRKDDPKRKPIELGKASTTQRYVIPRMVNNFVDVHLKSNNAGFKSMGWMNSFSSGCRIHTDTKFDKWRIRLIACIN